VLAGDSYPLNVTGYYHKNAASFSRRIDTSGIWFSGNTGVATVSSTGVAAGAAAGGPVPVYASIGSLSDTALVTVMPKPAIIKRINFQVSSTPWSYGWLADNGGAFSAAAGYGWVGAGGLSSRDDRVGSTNFLLKSFVSTGSAAQYRVALPDGEYIIKLALGDNQYGSTDTAWVGTQVVLAHTGASNGIAIDTVTVSGGGGLVLTVKGVFNYLVVISKEGIDINAVADDNGTAVPIPPSGTEMRVRAVSVPLLSVYPNPARGVVMICTPLQGRVDLAIYNIRGKKVAKLSSHTWNTSGLPAGIYLVKLTQGKRTYCARLVLMK